MTSWILIVTLTVQGKTMIDIPGYFDDVITCLEQGHNVEEHFKILKAKTKCVSVEAILKECK